MEAGEGRCDPRPRHKEGASHGHADGAAIEGIARTWGEQHSIYAQSCGRTKDGTDVGGVYYPIYHHNALSVVEHRFEGEWCWTSHGAEHSTCEGVAGERSQEFTLASVDGNVATAFDKARCVARDVPFFAEQRQRHITSIESNVDDFRTFGNEDAL